MTSTTRDADVPRVSIVVPTIDRGPEFLATVSSILDNQIPIELIVIDQSKDDATERLLDQNGMLHDSRVVYRRSRVKSGCRARNVGTIMARAEIIGFIDHDCVIDQTWAETVVHRFDEHPEMTLTYHALVAPRGDAGKTGGWTPVYHPRTEGRVLKSYRAVNDLGFGGNCAVRKAALLDIGLFDEYLGPGSVFGAGEDTDLGYRAMLADYGVYIFNDPPAIHLGRREGRAASIQGTRYVKSTAGYCMKHARCGDVDMLVPIALAAAGFVARGTGLLVRGKQPSGYRAAHGIVAGVAASYRLRIDRRKRLYTARR